MVKNLPANVGIRFSPWVGKIPSRRKWQPSAVFSCLGNPIDRGAWGWRATVHGVTESDTIY